ncbi:hypothetical protein JYT59_00260 [Sphingobacteriaceae bacterium AH-315-L07]|nr:hypothetical protein [Bacteroidia bacterium]MBN4052163.1 hypothetical protein [Sphingobacteriaceae bacterium AH-315-L07]
MKKLITIITVLGLYSSTNVFGQCSINLLFPVKISMTKFQVINSLNLLEDVYRIRSTPGSWNHPEYLNGDSVHKSEVNFEFKSHNCIKSEVRNVVSLGFADKRLYKMTLEIWFEPEEFNKCLENYNQILESLKKEFTYYSEFIVSDIENNEQMGEGVWLYKSEEEKHKDKFEEVSICYEFQYDTVFIDKLMTRVKTGSIDYYKLEISFVNLKGTKLERAESH